MTSLRALGVAGRTRAYEITGFDQEAAWAVEPACLEEQLARAPVPGERAHPDKAAVRDILKELYKSDAADPGGATAHLATAWFMLADVPVFQFSPWIPSTHRHPPHGARR